MTRPLLLLLLSGCAGAPSWSESFDPTGQGALSGVWGSGPDDVFVVGGTPEQGSVQHFDGEAWSTMSVPAVPLLVWVTGFGPDDVWAVGEGGGMVHWDGSVWTRIETGLTDDLWGIHGVGPGDMWVVGGDVQEGPPILASFDGEVLEPVTLDETNNPRDAASIFKVWGIGDRLWAVGQRGLILSKEGPDWVRQPAGELADDDFVALWGTGPGEVLAVGGRSNARMARFDGTGWETFAPTGVPGLSAVWMDDAGTAYVGGLQGFVGTVAPGTTDVTAEGPVTSLDVHAAWGAGPEEVHAVGGRFFEPYEGIAVVRREGR